MLIDLWDFETLPEKAHALLTGNDELYGEFIAEEAKIDGMRPRHGWSGQRPKNCMHDPKADIEAQIAELVAHHYLRCFHYSRMCDAEVGILKEIGIVPASPKFLEERLARLVTSGDLPEEMAREIGARSTLRFEGRYPHRNGLYWVTVWPLPVDHEGVVDLLASWGGESAYFALENKAIADRLAAIGAPRVVELSAPIAAINGDGPACVAGRLVDLRMGQLGLIKKPPATDVAIGSALPPGAVLCVHTEGEDTFETLACGYPSNYNAKAD